jgi:hypothetical protein
MPAKQAVARGILLGMALIAACPVSSRAQLAKTSNPHGGLKTGMDCSACHTPEAWKPARRAPDFDHSKSSRFALVGKHEEANCRSCHLDLRFDQPSIAASDCASCHVDVHLGQLSNECSSCHTTLGFADVPGLALHSRTSFPLSGSHLQISCESCHRDDRGGAYTTLLADCVTCHEADYANAESVDHVSLNFPTDCERCHTTLGWGGGGTFDHITASNGFALTGAHATLECNACHDPNSTALRFPAPANQNDCAACHLEDYARQHGGSGLPTSCRDCHGNVTWGDASFDHTAVSNGFQLLGTHATLECDICHEPTTNNLRFPPPASQNDCIACHQDEYNRQHSGRGFQVNCLECHSQTTWSGASFDHIAASNGFDLLGAHANFSCTACHDPATNSLLFPPPAGQNDCIACHQDDYNRQHNSSGFPTACLDCHNQRTWLGATFQHDQLFPVNSGKHSGKWSGCDTCHNVPGDYRIFTCFDCHQHSQTRMDQKHGGVSSYSYDSNACYSCHPNGRV